MFIKLVKIGQNAETRYTPQGKAVTSFSCAYDVGYGYNKKTQWIEASLWGERGEKLAENLVKGRELLLTADDVCVETYSKNDNSTGVKLKCRVISVEFTSGSPSQNQQT